MATSKLNMLLCTHPLHTVYDERALAGITVGGREGATFERFDRCVRQIGAVLIAWKNKKKNIWLCKWRTQVKASLEITSFPLYPKNG